MTRAPADTIIEHDIRQQLLGGGTQAWRRFQQGANEHTVGHVRAGSPDFTFGEPTYRHAMFVPEAYQQQGLSEHYAERCHAVLRTVLGPELPLLVDTSLLEAGRAFCIEVNQAGYERLTQQLGQSDVGALPENVTVLSSFRGHGGRG